MNNLFPHLNTKRTDPYRILIILAILFRLWMGLSAGYWFDSDQLHDDVLFINYCNPFTHNHLGSITPYPNMRIIKESSFSLLLSIIYLSGINYGFMLTVLYFAAAVLTYRTISYFTNNKNILLFSFLYVLFFPSAFDQWLGTRVYRNAILIPCILITFSLLTISALHLLHSFQRNTLISNLALMFLFPFTCYIKEDGIWIVAVVAVISLLELIYLFSVWIQKKKKNLRNIIVWVLIVCIPLGGYWAYKKGIELFNLKQYGVALTNSRTEGELSDFVNLVYKIESPDRTAEIWAPKDAIDKAFSASNTFQKYSHIYNNTIHTPKWFGDIETNPIKGDFLTWVLRDAIQADKLWTSEKDVQDIFRLINSELREAFNSGKLTKDKKIQLISSMGGRSLSEIVELFPDMIYIFQTFLSLKSYNFSAYPSVSTNSTIESTEKTLHTPLHERTTIQVLIGKIASIYSVAYIVINWLLFLYAIFSVIRGSIRIIRKKATVTSCFVTITCILLFGVSLAYSCAISWFCSFLTGNIHPICLKFYGCGVVPLLILICLISFASNIPHSNSFMPSEQRSM